MRNSLQVQLLAAVLVSEVLVAAGLLVIGRRSLEKQLMIGMDSELTGRAMSVAALVRFSEDQSSTLIFDRGLAPQSLEPGLADAYQVLGPRHTVLGRSAYWPQELGAGTSVPTGFWTMRMGDREFRGVRLDGVPILDSETGTPVSATTLTVIYATSTRAMRGQLFSDTLSIICAALVLILVTGIFAAWLLHRYLSPLRQLATEAGHISAQKWKFEPLPRTESIIELRPLVQSLRTMVEGLRRSFDSQRDFIANAAHELKTPITIQKSTLQLLLHHGLTADEYRTGLQQALRDTQRVEDLLQRLLKLAKAEHGATGTAIRHLEFVSLSSSCEAALIQMQPYAESRGVVLEMHGDGSARVKADMDDLVLIWTNLLENAIRYSPRDGHVVFKIDGCEQQMATVTVQDDGCGIEREQHERIFERFYRGDQSRARETGGVGLGLAMVKLLVEQYGGTVHVDSSKDRGATFIVSLPLY